MNMNQIVKKLVPYIEGKPSNTYNAFIGIIDGKVMLQFSACESSIDYGAHMVFTSAESRRLAYLFEQAADRLDGLVIEQTDEGYVIDPEKKRA